MAKLLEYQGSPLKELGLDNYVPSPELKDAVNLSILLKQPLLLMGEPGSGKTRLAEAVAAELHGDAWRKHYYRWDIKSISKARDGIYQYDALARLYDATNARRGKAKRVSSYITYGQFAKALTEPQNGEIPNILLIDEIDKADIDFPNDLLLEIEKGESFIPELNQSVKKKSEVIIFITSNRERELPAAFLRRCLYHYINFPNARELSNIISSKFSKNEGDPLVEKAVMLFLDLRSKIEGQFAENEKKPATSELIEWFKAIDHYNTAGETGGFGTREQSFIELIKNYEKGSLDKMNIPFRQALLKTLESNQLFEKNSYANPGTPGTSAVSFF